MSFSNGRSEEASAGGNTSPSSASLDEEEESPTTHDVHHLSTENILAALTKADRVGECWPLPLNAYKPDVYELSRKSHRCFDEDTRKALEYLRKYQPGLKGLSAPLKPCVADYVLATGNVDTLLKIPRPDGKVDDLGLTTVDEPGLQQSHPALLNLKLRTLCRRRLTGEQRQKPAGSIRRAQEKPREIDRWIRGVEELRESYYHNEVHYSQLMPSTRNLMQEWPTRLQQAFSAHFSDMGCRSNAPNTARKDAPLRMAALDLNIADTTKVVCSLLGIPWQKHRLIESLHVLWGLYLDSSDSTQSSPALG